MMLSKNMKSYYEKYLDKNTEVNLDVKVKDIPQEDLFGYLHRTYLALLKKRNEYKYDTAIDLITLSYERLQRNPGYLDYSLFAFAKYTIMEYFNPRTTKNKQKKFEESQILLPNDSLLI